MVESSGSMNFFEKLLYALQKEMTEPIPFGWFHLVWLGFMTVAIIILFMQRKRYSEKQLKIVLIVYGIIAFLLELFKQLIWSFNYDLANNIITWDYQWYAAPFQLCTTPMYISLICLFLKDGKLRNSLLSYIAFVTILGSITTIFVPESCFTSDILVNIHTMWLHYGSFAVSIYLLMSGAVKINKQNLKNAFIVFIVFVLMAEFLNIVIYHSGMLGDETFNMFYISPYFISSLPVFDIIQQSVPFIVYLLSYIVAMLLGSVIIYYIAYFIKQFIFKTKKGKII